MPPQFPWRPAGLDSEPKPRHYLVMQPSYIVGRNTVSAGRFQVSTVLLNPDQGGSDYETLVCPDGEWGDLERDCYSSLEDALKGHERMVARWQNARYVSCLNCLEEGDSSRPAVWLSDDYCCCFSSSDHKRFCAVCSSEEPCFDHLQDRSEQ